jgi:hypothetical protein
MSETRLAHEVFSHAHQTNIGKPGSKANSKSFSLTFSNKNFQTGGNRLTGAWHPQVQVPKDRKQLPTLTARPTQHRTVERNQISNRAGQKVPFNNTNKRPLAGSAHAGVTMAAYKGANTLTNQRNSRATARAIQGVNTTTRRGGSSNAVYAKPVAGTQSTYAVPGPSGGRNTAQLVKVTSVHHIGFHKIVTTQHVSRSINRLQGQASSGKVVKKTFTKPRGEV